MNTSSSIRYIFGAYKKIIINLLWAAHNILVVNNTAQNANDKQGWSLLKFCCAEVPEENEECFLSQPWADLHSQ